MGSLQLRPYRAVIIRAKQNKHVLWAVEAVLEVHRKYSRPEQCPYFKLTLDWFVKEYDEVQVVENVE